MIAWVVLLVAGLFEIGWPVGLKLAQSPGRQWLGFGVAAACLVVSGALLFIAQKQIPLGTAYAVWAGIGAAGTFMVGVMFFNDPASMGRTLGVVLIVAGVATLKLAP